MADTVSSQTLHDGERKAVLKFTNQSDGTGEAAVTKVDVSALSGTPAKVKITRVWYATFGMGVKMLWDATTDLLAWTLGADDSGCLDFRDIGGIQNDAGTGVTGDLVFTTVGHTAGDSYSVVVEVEKA